MMGSEYLIPLADAIMWTANAKIGNRVSMNAGCDCVLDDLILEAVLCLLLRRIRRWRPPRASCCKARSGGRSSNGREQSISLRIQISCRRYIVFPEPVAMPNPITGCHWKQVAEKRRRNCDLRRYQSSILVWLVHTPALSLRGCTSGSNVPGCLCGTKLGFGSPASKSSHEHVLGPAWSRSRESTPPA